MYWDIVSIRMGIVSMYRDNHVSQIEVDDEGYHYFRYSSDVDINLVGEKIGVKHSGPSHSSSSTD